MKQKSGCYDKMPLLFPNHGLDDCNFINRLKRDIWNFNKKDLLSKFCKSTHHHLLLCMFHSYVYNWFCHLLQMFCILNEVLKNPVAGRILIGNPKTIILHCGTNDLSSPQAACNIAQDILDLAKTLETGNNTVIVSGLVPRVDFLNGKAIEVNKVLKQFCQSKNLKFIDNSNIDQSIHLNRCRHHLNDYGTTLLANNFIFNLGY